MKKFDFTIHGNRYQVQIQSIEDNQALVLVNGSEYAVEIHDEKLKEKTPRLVREQAVPDSSSHHQRTSSPSAPKGVGLVKSPLPGTILELKVKVGDTVARGAVLMIMEAMKMENEIRSDRAGVVRSLLVAQGESVLEGASLAEIGESA
ncbi:MAG: biotin attachment protein [Candidatus Delongbacteria bacterium]|nr:biotin attachment protein [Candidatus Delongbacteria bacterium]